MIVFYKNYKRTERVLLSIQSVRHLFPDIEIRCLLLYDKDENEYDGYLKLFEKLNVKLYFDKKTYNFGKSSVCSANNGFYFTEGINKIFKIVEDLEEKVFILDEDQFFTTGKTIDILLTTEFDLAVSCWHSPPPITYSHRPQFEVNGAFLAIRPNKFKNIFPLPEKYEYIESLLGYELYIPTRNNNLTIFNIPTRSYNNYFGDGVHTNNMNEIMFYLKKFNIPYTLDL